MGWSEIVEVADIDVGGVIVCVADNVGRSYVVLVGAAEVEDTAVVLVLAAVAMIIHSHPLTPAPAVHADSPPHPVPSSTVEFAVLNPASPAATDPPAARADTA